MSRIFGTGGGRTRTFDKLRLRAGLVFQASGLWSKTLLSKMHFGFLIRHNWEYYMSCRCRVGEKEEEEEFKVNVISPCLVNHRLLMVQE